MHGNVSEWCQDWVSFGVQPPGKEAKDSKDPYLLHDQQGRVLRGGSFNVLPLDLGSSLRYWNQPVNEVAIYGFRVARTLTAE